MALEKKLTDGGGKAMQRTGDTEDRSLPYRSFRREVCKKGSKKETPYTCDIDQVEYIISKDQVYPVALIDITRYDQDEYAGKPESWSKYRAAVLDRYFFRDNQGNFMRTIANMLKIPAYLVLFRKDVQSFWVFEMTRKDADWVRMDQEEYMNFLKKLRTDAFQKLQEEATTI